MKRLMTGIFCLIAACSSWAQSGWVKVNSGTTEELNGVYFQTPNRVWAVGGTRDDSYTGKVIRSTDKGQTWRSQTSNTTKLLKDVHFYNATHGWAVGYSGVLLRTTNGGDSWQVSFMDSAYTQYAVFFLNQSLGWACGTNASIIKTTNGGKTWTLKNTAHIVSPYTGRQPKMRGIYFISSSTGWAVGHDRWILKTTDGGTSWHQQYSIDSDEDLRYVQFLNSQTGYAIGERGIILKTTNGGSSWKHLNSGTEENFLGGFFVDVNTGWAVGDNGTVVKTIDGGNRWVKQNTGTNRDLKAIMFVDKDTGVLVGEDGLIMRTTSGGNGDAVPPVITSVDAITVEAGRAFDYTLTAEDPNGLDLAFSYSDVPSWMTVDGPVISGTPSAFHQDTVFTCQVNNGIHFVEQKVQVAVLHPNHAPRLTSPQQVTATEDIPFAYAVQTADEDGDAVQVQIQNTPSWAVVHGNLISGTPVEGDGNTGFDIILSDSEDSRTFHVSIQVIAVNDAPQILSAGIARAVEDQPFEYVIEAVDEETSDLAYTADFLPVWLSLEDSLLTGTPGETDGDVRVTLSASDGQLQDTLHLYIQIQTVNEPPVWMSDSLVTAVEDMAFTYRPEAVDPEGLPVTLDILSLPSWLFASDSLITGTPVEGMQDTCMVLTASDGQFTDTLKIGIQMIAVNDPPMIKNLTDIIFDNAMVYSINLDTCAADPDDGAGALHWDVFSEAEEVTVFLQDHALFLTAIQWHGKTTLFFRVTDEAGASDSLTVNLWVQDAASVNAASLPGQFELNPNYPNPFNPQTVISFTLPKRTDVEINIYNTRGEKNRCLVKRTFNAGQHQTVWHADGMAAGIYFIQLKTEEHTAIQKCMLVK